MKTENLSVADKYLLIGYLLKKERPEDLDKKALRIIRGTGTLDRKIEALFSFNRQGGSGREGENNDIATSRSSKTKKTGAGEKPAILIIDSKPGFTESLKKTSLRRKFVFERAENFVLGLLSLKKGGGLKIIILNQSSRLHECYRVSNIIQGIEPQARIIILCSKSQGEAPEQDNHNNIQLVYKPINIAQIEKAIRELML